MSLRAINVLLVEDNPFAARHIQRMIIGAVSPQFVAAFRRVGTLSAGLKYLAENKVDVVLLDLSMPDLGELETLARVYASAPEVPVIVLAGLEDETLAMEAVQSGAQDYLVKGEIDSNLIKRSIVYAIERKRGEEELKNYRDHLEELINERTAALTATNKQLQKEAVDRKRAEKAREKAYQKLKIVHKELKQSQSQLIQTEKMVAIGTLAAGIAHELDNPLMAIQDFSNYCLKYTGADDRRYSYLQDMEREAGRCIGIVNNLLTFSHSEQIEEAFIRESLAEIVERAVNLLSFRLKKENVTLTRRLNGDIPPVTVRVNGIQQVIINLLTNALDAVAGNQRKEIYISGRAGNRVRLSIADSGTGIAPEIMNRIYDPFFTTKPPGKGTGLGLSISRSIIDSHGGTIACKSKPGVGTTFLITLPLKNERM